MQMGSGLARICRQRIRIMRIQCLHEFLFIYIAPLMRALYIHELHALYGALARHAFFGALARHEFMAICEEYRNEYDIGIAWHI